MPPTIVDCAFKPPGESANAKAPVVDVNCGFDPDLPKPPPATAEKESAPSKSRK